MTSIKYGLRQVSLGLLLTLVSGIICAWAADEYVAKANHLFQFARNVKWPPTKELAFCVIGPDPFRGALEAALQGKKIAGRSVQLRHISAAQAGSCQLLFISGGAGGGQSATALSHAGATTLTVGERAGFIQQGGIINFVIEGGRVRYELNKSLADKKGLKLGYDIINLAKKRY